MVQSKSESDIAAASSQVDVRVPTVAADGAAATSQVDVRVPTAAGGAAPASILSAVSTSQSRCC